MDNPMVAAVLKKRHGEYWLGLPAEVQAIHRERAEQDVLAVIDNLPLAVMADAYWLAPDAKTAVDGMRAAVAAARATVTP